MIDIDNIKDFTTAEFKKGSLEIDYSTLEALKKMPIDIFDNIYIGEVKPEALILCIDIRGFSDFLCTHDEKTVFSLITLFTSNFLSCVNQFGYGCSYYKLLGDGALIIWDCNDIKNLQEAITIFQIYKEFLKEEIFAPYPELGIGGALVMEKVYKYEISAEASQLKYRDYVGYGINLACRLQTLAEKSELVINKKLAELNTISFEIKNTDNLIKELLNLKGLRKTDQQQIYFYTK